MPLKVLIVDDEYPARMELRYQLEKLSSIEITGEASNAREAMRLIEALDYDVVFLDVQMPGMTGMELARLLKERASAPSIVFVTAYEHYALPAFEMRAVDYLLKPFESQRLAETIERLRQLKQGATSGVERRILAENPSERRSPLQFLLCERNNKQVPIPLQEIIYIVADGYDVFVQTLRERLQTRYTMQELAERLPPDQFFRTHRSYVVNVMQVAEITPHFHGTYLLKMKDREQTEVTVSRKHAKRMKDIFSF